MQIAAWYGAVSLAVGAEVSRARRHVPTDKARREADKASCLLARVVERVEVFLSHKQSQRLETARRSEADRAELEASCRSVVDASRRRL